MYKKIAMTVGIVLAVAFIVTASSPQDRDERVVSAQTPTALPETVSECSTIATSIKATVENTVPEIEVEEVVEETVSEPIRYYTDDDAVDIAKVLYRECRGIPSVTEQACVAWTVLNRVDMHGSSIHDVVRAKNQFAFYESTPVDDGLLELSYDVLERWNREKNGEDNVGRVLPKDYTYFGGRNGHNYFRNKYSGSCNTWDYLYESPYEN